LTVYWLPQVLQEGDADKIAVCSEYMHYLMTGLEALPSYSVEGTETILWRGVSRFDVKNRCVAILVLISANIDGA
jgi:hypothetical protein